MNKSSAGTWVKVVAILGYIGAILMFLAGILLIVSKSLLGSIPQFKAMLGGSIGAILVLIAIVLILVGVFEFIVALYLWKYKNWARIVMFVLAVIGFVLSVISIAKSPVMSIIGLVIEGGIFYLLAINKDVVKLFK